MDSGLNPGFSDSQCSDVKISDSTDYWCQGWVRAYEPLSAAEEYLEQKLSRISSSSPVGMKEVKKPEQVFQAQTVEKAELQQALGCGVCRRAKTNTEQLVPGSESCG